MIERQLQPGANGPWRGALTRESCLRTMDYGLWTMRLCLTVPASTLEPLGPHEPPAARNLSQKPPSSIAACSSFDIGAPAASDLVQQLQPPAREPHQQWPAIPDTVKAMLNMGHQHHCDDECGCEEEKSSCQCAGNCSSSGHPPLADGFGDDQKSHCHDHMPRRIPPHDHMPLLRLRTMGGEEEVQQKAARARDSGVETLRRDLWGEHHGAACCVPG